MRKPHPQSPLNQLTPEKRERLHGWFAENLTYVRIRELMEKELGVKTSETALGEYYQKHGYALLLLGQREQAAPLPDEATSLQVRRTGPRSYQIDINNLPEGMPALAGVLEAALLAARMSE